MGAMALSGCGGGDPATPAPSPTPGPAPGPPGEVCATGLKWATEDGKTCTVTEPFATSVLIAPGCCSAMDGCKTLESIPECSDFKPATVIPPDNLACTEDDCSNATLLETELV